MKAAVLGLLIAIIAPQGFSQEAGTTTRVILNSYLSTQLGGITQFRMPSDGLGMPKGTAIMAKYSVGPGPFRACVVRVIKPDGASMYSGNKCLATITPLPETRISQYIREVQIDGGQLLLMTWGE